MKSPIQLFIALAVLLAAATVAAQVYKWVDKDGKVQFSDQPPPDSKTDAKKIDIKPASGAPPAPAAKTPVAAGKPSVKTRAEEVEKAKKAADEEKINAQKAEACEGSKAYMADLQSGRPINRTTPQGERAFMTDEERAAEIAKTRALQAEACK